MMNEMGYVDAKPKWPFLSRVQLMDAPDTTNPDYWLNWRVFVCAIWVLGSMVSASFMIWKNKGSTRLEHDRKETSQHLPDLFRDDDAWRTCLREIHPFWLLAYRVVSFFLLSAILASDIMIHGAKILFYYTQWTFTLITIYFGLASVLSFYGCYKRHKIGQSFIVSQLEAESTHGSYFPLSYGEEISAALLEGNSSVHEEYVLEAGIWGNILQVLFQLTAGAVVLTDCVYWSIIYPFLTIYDYDLHMMTYVMHSVNFVFILGDTALNSLPFPWFRMSYFVLWTGIFVVSQWIIHAFVSIRWPYPFLELSSPFSPLWYVLVGLMQLPCYGIFVMIVEAKVSFLSRRFPQSCQCRR